MNEKQVVRTSALISLGFVAGLLASFVFGLLDAPRAEAQPGAAAKWEHKVFVPDIDVTSEKMLKQVDDGGWEYAGFSITAAQPAGIQAAEEIAFLQRFAARRNGLSRFQANALQSRCRWMRRLAGYKMCRRWRTFCSRQECHAQNESRRAGSS